MRCIFISLLATFKKTEQGTSLNKEEEKKKKHKKVDPDQSVTKCPLNTREIRESQGCRAD